MTQKILDTGSFSKTSRIYCILGIVIGPRDTKAMIPSSPTALNSYEESHS